MVMCALTEDDHHRHPCRLRELSLRIPKLNNYTGGTYLHEQWE